MDKILEQEMWDYMTDNLVEGHKRWEEMMRPVDHHKLQEAVMKNMSPEKMMRLMSMAHSMDDHNKLNLAANTLFIQAQAIFFKEKYEAVIKTNEVIASAMSK